MHTFTKSEIHEAEHLFERRIKSVWGEVWRIKSDGEYKGIAWDCKSPLLFVNGIWTLCHRAKHQGATRAAGRIETREAGDMLRFILFYERNFRLDS